MSTNQRPDRRGGFADAVFDVATAAARLDLPEVSRVAVEHAVRLLGADAGAVFLWDETSQLLVPVYETPSDSPEPSVRSGEGMIGLAFAERRPRTTRDYQRWRGRIAVSARRGMGGALAVPLSISERSTGAIGVWAYQPRAFRPSEIKLLSLFGANIAPVVEVVRLRDALAGSEQRLHSLFDAMDAGVVLHDAAGVVRTANAAVRSLIGGGNSTRPIFDPSRVRLSTERGALLEASDWPSQVALRTGSSVHGIYKLETDERPVVWLRIQATPQLGAGGRVEGVVTTILDVSDLQAAKLELAQSEAKYRQLVEEVPACTYRSALDQAGTILYVSPQAESLFGYSLSEWYAPGFWHRMIHQEDVDLVIREWTKGALGAPGRFDLEYRVRTATGTVRWVRDNGAVVVDARGVPLYVNGVLLDVTERVEAERIRHAAEQLRRESEATNRFIRTISHELRTPLNSVLGFAQLLQGRAGALDERQRRYVDNIVVSGMNLLSLINDLLDLAKAGSGALVASPERCELIRIAHKSVEAVKPVAEAAGHQVSVVGGDDVWAVADPLRLQQVVFNLLSNAIKFTPPGGRITVTIWRGDRAYIAVSDTGVGIDPADQDRIFDEFFQVAGANHSTLAGTGLGLSLSKRLVELMGGEISVDSTPGEGSTFTVSLPVAAQLISIETAASATG
jgi:PAS domain S-box-containing protein